MISRLNFLYSERVQSAGITSGRDLEGLFDMTAGTPRPVVKSLKANLTRYGGPVTLGVLI